MPATLETPRARCDNEPLSVLDRVEPGRPEKTYPKRSALDDRRFLAHARAMATSVTSDDGIPGRMRNSPPADGDDGARRESAPESPGRTAREAPVSDLLVRRALRLFEQEPRRRWTVEELAAELGTSRPVLGRRFVASLGKAPLRVLREMRLNVAARRLVTTDDGLVAIADAVGYDSEFAFSRAFLRHFGVRPGRYRQQYAPLMLAA